MNQLQRHVGRAALAAAVVAAVATITVALSTGSEASGPALDPRAERICDTLTDSWFWGFDDEYDLPDWSDMTGADKDAFLDARIAEMPVDERKIAGDCYLWYRGWYAPVDAQRPTTTTTTTLPATTTSTTTTLPAATTTTTLSEAELHESDDPVLALEVKSVDEFVDTYKANRLIGSATDEELVELFYSLLDNCYGVSTLETKVIGDAVIDGGMKFMSVMGDMNYVCPSEYDRIMTRYVRQVDPRWSAGYFQP